MKNIDILLAARILAAAKVSKVNGIVSKMAVSKLFNDIEDAVESIKKQIVDLKSRGASESELNSCVDVDFVGFIPSIDAGSFEGLVESNDFSLSEINIISKFVQNGKES